jgi:hypothetical protein
MAKKKEFDVKSLIKMVEAGEKSGDIIEKIKKILSNLRRMIASSIQPTFLWRRTYFICFLVTPDLNWSTFITN